MPRSEKLVCEMRHGRVSWAGDSTSFTKENERPMGRPGLANSSPCFLASCDCTGQCVLASDSGSSHSSYIQYSSWLGRNFCDSGLGISVDICGYLQGIITWGNPLAGGDCSSVESQPPAREGHHGTSWNIMELSSCSCGMSQ